MYFVLVFLSFVASTTAIDVFLLCLHLVFLLVSTGMLNSTVSVSYEPVICTGGVYLMASSVY